MDTTKDIEVDKTKESTARRVKEFLPDAPTHADALLPPDAMLDDGMLYFGDKVIGRPAIISGILEGHDGRRHIEVAMFVDGVWKPVTVKAETLADRREIIMGLAPFGLEATSITATAYIEYFAQYISLNRELIPVRKSSAQAGWLDDGKHFALGTTVIGPEPDRLTVQAQTEGEQQALEAFGQAGSQEEWLSLLGRLPDMAPVWIALYLAIGAMLQKLVGFTRVLFLEFVGETSTGKTLALKLVASAFGKPGGDGKTGLVNPWRQTAVSHERRAALTPDLPVFLDDLSSEFLPALEQTFYTLANGTEKGRGKPGGLTIRKSFNCVILSTGEVSLDSCSRKAGVRARLVSITETPIGADQAQLALDIERICERNYGHVGRAVAEHLAGLSDTARAALTEQFRKLESELMASVTGNIAKRAASTFALITLGGMVLHEVVWLLGDPGERVGRSIVCVTDRRVKGDPGERVGRFWQTYCNEFLPEAPLGKRAYEFIVDWFEENRSRFHEPACGFRHTLFVNHGGSGQTYGSVVDLPDGTQSIAVIPKELDGVLSFHRFDPKVVLRELRSRGLLITDGSRLTHNVTIGGDRRIRCYHIRLMEPEGEA